MEDGAAVFDGLTPPAFHAGEFWVGVCLKTKPPEGERGGETFVDKIDAKAHDWIVSVRVTGIPTVEGRVAALAQAATHFGMYVREELGAVDQEDFDAVFTSSKEDDEPWEAKPHSSSRVFSLITSTDDGAVRVQEMLAPKQVTEEETDVVPMDVKERMILTFTRGYRQHLVDHGVSIAGYAFQPGDSVTYTVRTGVGWFRMLPAAKSE